MLEIYNENEKLLILDSSKNKISLDKENFEIDLNDFNLSYPWEYEKSWILLEVKEYQDKLFYNFFIAWKHLVIISSDNFELSEEILSFLWDIDILIIKASKQAAKIYENIEARVIVPYWEEKDIFLNTLGQNIEEVDLYKFKWDFDLENSEFVNLK